MNLDFDKGNGLIPAVIQDSTTLKVLMVGFMDRKAYEKTISEKNVTFFSRSRNELWTKGETSGNYLRVVEIKSDCDNDTLLILAKPEGPVCHKGSYSCFGENDPKAFLYSLEEIISQRIDGNVQDSYTNKVYRKGINKIAQKVGEEAVELVIEAKDDNLDQFKNEAADLLYHMLILLKAKNVKLTDIEEVLMSRHK